MQLEQNEIVSVCGLGSGHTTSGQRLIDRARAAGALCDRATGGRGKSQLYAEEPPREICYS